MTGSYRCVHCRREQCGCVNPFDDRPSDFEMVMRRMRGPLARLTKTFAGFSTVFMTPFAQKQIEVSRQIDNCIMDVAVRRDVKYDLLMCAFKSWAKTLPGSYLASAEHLYDRSFYEMDDWDVIGWLESDGE